MRAHRYLASARLQFLPSYSVQGHKLGDGGMHKALGPSLLTNFKQTIPHRHGQWANPTQAISQQIQTFFCGDSREYEVDN